MCTTSLDANARLRVDDEGEGFPPALLETVHNGIPLDGTARTATLRGDLGIPEDAVLVAHVGRLAPVKNGRGGHPSTFEPIFPIRSLVPDSPPT